MVLAGQLAKLESKEKPDRAASEPQQGPRVSRAQLAVKGAPGLSGTQELLARPDLRAQRVQWAPLVWSGLRASQAQLETLVCATEPLCGASDSVAGAIGARGPAGLQGATGPVGAAGAPGAKGELGDKGQCVPPELEV